MKRIENLKDLRAAWTQVQGLLRRDFSAMRRLTADPVGTMQSLGFELSPPALEALRSSLP